MNFLIGEFPSPQRETAEESCKLNTQHKDIVDFQEVLTNLYVHPWP